MNDPGKREDEPTPDQETETVADLDAETVADLEPADPDQVAGGFRSMGCGL